MGSQIDKILALLGPDAGAMEKGKQRKEAIKGERTSGELASKYRVHLRCDKEVEEDSYKGVIPAMLTPLTREKKINFEATEKLVDFLLKYRNLYTCRRTFSGPKEA